MVNFRTAGEIPNAVDENVSVTCQVICFNGQFGLYDVRQESSASLVTGKTVFEDLAVRVDTCLCGSTNDFTEHVVGQCQFLALTEYTIQHEEHYKNLSLKDCYRSRAPWGLL